MLFVSGAQTFSVAGQMDSAWSDAGPDGGSDLALRARPGTVATIWPCRRVLGWLYHLNLAFQE